MPGVCVLAAALTSAAGFCVVMEYVAGKAASKAAEDRQLVPLDRVPNQYEATISCAMEYAAKSSDAIDDLFFPRQHVPRRPRAGLVSIADRPAGLQFASEVPLSDPDPFAREDFA